VWPEVYRVNHLRLLIFSDLHGHNFRPYSEVLSNGRNSRFQDILNVLENIYQVCKNQKVDGVLFGGDLFHARSVLNVSTFNDTYEAIAKIKTVVKFFVMVVGNHDQSNKLGTIHSTKTFNAIVDVIDRPMWIMESVGEENIYILGVPFSDNKEGIIQSIQEATNEKNCPDLETNSSVLLGHFGVSGAEPGANFVLRASDLPTIPDLEPDLFSQIFLGHYHMYQELIPNVRYVGAPLQHNWGDCGQQRSVTLWDTSPSGEYTAPTQIDMAAPEFVKVNYNEKTGSLCCDEGSIAGNFIRVIFDKRLPKEEWENLKEELLTNGQARWVEESLEVPKPELAESASTYSPNVDIEDMIDCFVDEADTSDLSKETLKELGHKFLESKGT
jgi:DNA repair exonuclease SbcCD nuclease subunit